jgi:nucleoside-triphosphatase THEP1
MAKLDTSDFMTFDEIGPMELEGKALHATFKSVLESYGGTVIAVVRKPLLERVMERYGIPGDNVVILHADKPWEEQLEKIVK